MKTRIVSVVLFVAAVCTLGLDRASAQSSGIVESVVSAPVSPDGDVAGRVTDLVINLDRSMDPSVLGRGLAVDKQVRITLPADFVDVGGFDTLPLTSGCVGTKQCDVAILLQGWPQNPIAPPTWTVSRTSNPDGSNTFTIEALADIVPVAGVAPGIKQLHLLFFGFMNPAAGVYDAWVEIDGPDESVETGVARIEIQGHTSPRLAVTSAFNGGPPNPNAIYQQTGVGEYAPAAMQLLLWDRSGRPMTDVKVVPSNFGARRAIVQLVRRSGKRVGRATITGPNGSAGFELGADMRSFATNAPVTGTPVARFPVMFKTGDLPGLYTIRFDMDQGNSMTFFVVASE